MSPRYRPVLSACGHLLHGVVTVVSKEDRRSRPVASALVSIVVNGDVVESTATRRDGSYSIVFGSCRREKKAVEETRLQVEKVTSCEKLRATRILHLDMASSGNGGRIWQEDMKVHVREITSLCEVSVNRTLDQEAARHTAISLDYEQGLKQVISGASVFFSLVWGLVLLWAIAKWATVNQPRRVHLISEDESVFTETQLILTEVDEERSAYVKVRRSSKLTQHENPTYRETSKRPSRTTRSSRRIPKMVDDDSSGED